MTIFLSDRTPEQRRAIACSEAWWTILLVTRRRLRPKVRRHHRRGPTANMFARSIFVNHLNVCGFLHGRVAAGGSAPERNIRRACLRPAPY